MRGHLKSRGFTIVETLIVITVSAAMFVLIALSLSGKQNSTEFTQAIQDTKSQIQKTINEVSSGEYPYNSNFTCSDSGGKVNIISGGPNGQGTHGGCIFLGKVMQFAVQGTGTATIPEAYNTFLLAGVQQDSSGQNIQAYSCSTNPCTDTNPIYTNAKPVAIYPAAATPGFPANYVASGNLLYGLTTHSISYQNTYMVGAGSVTSTPSIGAVAFVNSLNSYSGSSVNTGTQNVNVVPINGSALNSDKGSTADAVDNWFDQTPQPLSGAVMPFSVNPSSGVTLCFDSATTNQSGKIVIGGSQGQLALNLTIEDGLCP